MTGIFGVYKRQKVFFDEQEHRDCRSSGVGVYFLSKHRSKYFVIETRVEEDASPALPAIITISTPPHPPPNPHLLPPLRRREERLGKLGDERGNRDTDQPGRVRAHPLQQQALHAFLWRIKK